MTDKTETLLDSDLISAEADRFVRWAETTDPNRPLFIFWTCYSRPSIGGAQKRTATLADKVERHATVAFVHIRDEFGQSPGFPSFCFGSNGISHDAPLAIQRALQQAPSGQRFVYVDHVNYFEYRQQIAALKPLASAANQVFFLIASERTAHLVNAHADEIPLDGLRLHCLNDHTLSLLLNSGLPADRIEQYEDPREATAPTRDGPLVCCGRVVSEKNCLALVGAWLTLPAPLRGDVCLEFWGPVVDDYGRAVLDRIKKAGDGSIRYCGVYDSQNANPLKTANALVHPSLTEGASNVVVEAMAYGKPVIGSAIEGVGSLLPTNDFLIEQSLDVAKIRIALETYLLKAKDDVLYRDMCRQFANHQRQHYAEDTEFFGILDHFCLTPNEVLSDECELVSARTDHHPV